MVLSVPALVLVAMTAVGVTTRALHAAELSQARLRTDQALRETAEELKETDVVGDALREVIEDLEHDGFRAVVRVGDVTASTSLPLSPIDSEISAGNCRRLEASAEHARVVCRAVDTSSSASASASASASVSVVVGMDVSGDDAVIARLTRSMILIVVLALAVLGLAVLRLILSTTKSLDALVVWTADIAGDAEPPPAPRAPFAEIEQLATSFDTLLRRILESLKRERASAAFIAHEMRTPLAAMSAELEAIERGQAAPGATSRLRQDVARLARVVDSVLFLARREGESRRSEVVNIADVVRALAPAEATCVAPDEALFEGDPELLRLAISNLLDNSRHHAGHDARALTVTREDRLARITVTDDGAGVAPSVRARMFDRYWRANEEVDGTGLGLAIVRAVAERYGGSARAEPASDGRGLAVSFTCGPLVRWDDEPISPSAAVES
jgi:signal transduction histidine kinase